MDYTDQNPGIVKSVVFAPLRSAGCLASKYTEIRIITKRNSENHQSPNNTVLPGHFLIPKL